MFFKNYHRICPFYLGYPDEFRVGVMMEITVHFLVLRKKLVSYFASIERDVTIIINFENIADDNAFLARLRKR